MKRWLLPIIMIVVLAIGTLGAYAYFDSARETTGYISAGTLDLKLGLSESGPWENSVTLPWNFTNMAPGDKVAGKLYMMNVGTIPAKQVTFDWHNVLNDPTTKAFADQIILIHVWDSKNTVDAIAGVVGVADTSGDGKCSLAELAALSGRFGLPYDAVSDVDPFLPVGLPQYLHMEFQFNPAATNEFQGVNLSYGLTLTAEQMVVFPAPVVP